MTGSRDEFAERLFLLKSDSEEISVPCKDLAPHQIDGIRFLFKQYKKMKQGVIINYPSGCGASAQVALFISAIQKDLEKPVLILYDKVRDSWEWLERFSKWTTISADSIVCDAPNPYVKKLVYINNIANIDKLCARQWSIVIVKSDEVNQKYLRYLLKVNFKIWITSVDMRKDRTALKVIYSWMYDKSKTEINKFLHHKTDAKESYINNLLLDSLLEDVLLTRRDLTPFQNKKRLQRRHEPEIKVAPKISRKNKDATGLKIKRTKKTIDNESIAQQSINIKVDIEDEETKSDVESINIKVDDEDEETKLDVESFIRDNEPLESDSNFSMAISSLDCATHTSLPVNPKTEDASTHSFVKFRRSVNRIVDIDQCSALSVQLNNDSSQESISGNEIKPESGRYSNLSTLTIKNEEEEVENKSDLSNPDSTISSQNSRGLYLEFSNGFSLESDIVKDEEIEAGVEECDTTKMMPKIGEVFSLGAVKNESSDEEGNAIKKENEMCSDDSNDGEVTGDQDRKLELTTRVTQETENNFDLKMKQMEEQALKKFKGSFLDNMFKM